MKVEPLISFDHNGPRKVGVPFDVSDRIAGLLSRKGLVRMLGANTVPLAETGVGAATASSASPVDQVSLPKTSKKSKHGAKHSQDEE